MPRFIAPTFSGLRGYALALILVATSALVGHLIAQRWGTSAVDLIFLPAVIAAAVFAGLGPGLVAGIASALAYNYYFTAPFHTFVIHNPADVVTVVVLFLVAIVTSQLAGSMRVEAQRAEANARRNETIAGFARKLLSSGEERDIAAIVASELARLFAANTVVLANRPDLPVLAATTPAPALNPSDIAVAAMVAADGRPAGRGIGPHSAIEWQFYPVSADGAVIALVGLARDDGMPAAAEDRRNLLASLLDQSALAFERSRLDGEARGFATLRERDQVRTSLLSSIGADLAPAIGAIGQASDRLRRSGREDKDAMNDLLAETARLKRYLANLVDLAPASDQGPIEVEGVTIDLFRRSVARGGAVVHLTPKEYAVLAELAKHPGRVLGHAHLLRSAWGPAQEKQTEYLRVAVRGLRQKLEADPAHPRLIINQPGVGYRLNV